MMHGQRNIKLSQLSAIVQKFQTLVWQVNHYCFTVKIYSE